MANKTLDLLTRLGAGAAAGFGTGFAGALPGAFSLGTTGIKKGIEFLEPVVTKDTSTPQEDLSWFGKAQRFLDITPEKKDIKESIPYRALDSLEELAEKATPNELMSYLNEYTGDFFKPKSKTEEIAQGVFKDIGSIVGIGGGVGNALKMSIFGNTAYEASKFAGADESTAGIVKVGGMLLSPVFKRSMIPGMRKNLYNEADKVIPVGATANLPGIDNIAKGVIKKSLEGGHIAHRKAVARFAKDLAATSKNGRIPVKELWAFKRNLNDHITRGVFADKKRFLLGPLEKSIRRGLRNYGLKNKEFGNAFKNADTLFGIEKGLPLLDKTMNKVFGVRDTGLGEYFRKALVYGQGGLKGLAAKKGLASVSRGVEAYFRSNEFRKAANDLAIATSKNSLPAASEAMKELAKIKKKFEGGFKNDSGLKFRLINTPSKEDTQKIDAPEKKFKVILPDELAKMRLA